MPSARCWVWPATWPRGGRRSCAPGGTMPCEPPEWLSALDGDGRARRAGGVPEGAGCDRGAGHSLARPPGDTRPKAQRAGEADRDRPSPDEPGIRHDRRDGSNASSTAELVFRLIQRMGGELPDHAAACLYAGIVTDTGRFQYEATTPATLRVAAATARARLRPCPVGPELFEDGPSVFLRVRRSPWRVFAGARSESGLDVHHAGGIWPGRRPTLGDTDDLIDVVRDGPRGRRRRA